MPGNQADSTTAPDRDRQPAGLTWTAMLAIIAIACALAGIIAYRLVAPFFPHH